MPCSPVETLANEEGCRGDVCQKKSCSLRCPVPQRVISDSSTELCSGTSHKGLRSQRAYQQHIPWRNPRNSGVRAARRAETSPQYQEPKASVYGTEPGTRLRKMRPPYKLRGDSMLLGQQEKDGEQEQDFWGAPGGLLVLRTAIQEPCNTLPPRAFSCCSRNPHGQSVFSIRLYPEATEEELKIFFFHKLRNKIIIIYANLKVVTRTARLRTSHRGFPTCSDCSDPVFISVLL